MRAIYKFFVIVFILFSPIPAAAQWVQTNSPDESAITSLAFISSTQDTFLFAGTTNKIFITSDFGETWEPLNTGIDNVRTLYSIDTVIFVGAYNGVFLIENDGGQWKASNKGLTDVRSLIIKDTILYASTFDGVFQSGINNFSWTEILNESDIQSVTLMEDHIFAAFGDAKDASAVLWSGNGGNSWGSVFSAGGGRGVGSVFYSLGIADTNLIISAKAGDDNVYCLTYHFNGVNWSILYSDMPKLYIYEFLTVEEFIFGATVEGVYYSKNNGINWLSAGLENEEIYSLAAFNGVLYAGTGDGNVWKRPINEIVTSVDQLRGNIPDKFGLLQNYPNPFNPSTTITYSIPLSGNVVMEVYDMLGRKITEPVNEFKQAGEHKITFDAASLSSGVYFYSITAGNYHSVKKMTVLK